MSFSRSLVFWRLSRAVRRGALLRAVASVPNQSLGYNCLSARFSTTSRRRADVEESSSSSESDSDSDSESSALHGSPLLHETEPDERAAILKACLYLVREGGWSAEVLAEGAKEAGLEGLETELFPNGPGDLVNMFEQQCNEKLFRYMEKQKDSGVEGSKMIQPSIEHRLKMLSPYIGQWPQAMALKAYPPVVPTALENLSLMVDDIWYMAGDRSADINWYTKRGVLAAIYTSTELYMVQDESDGFQETWRFLDHRLQSVHDVSSRVHQIGGVGKGFVDLVCAGLHSVRGTIGEMTGRR